MRSTKLFWLLIGSVLSSQLIMAIALSYQNSKQLADANIWDQSEQAGYWEHSEDLLERNDSEADENSLPWDQLRELYDNNDDEQPAVKDQEPSSESSEDLDEATVDTKEGSGSDAKTDFFLLPNNEQHSYEHYAAAEASGDVAKPAAYVESESEEFNQQGRKSSEEFDVRYPLLDKERAKKYYYQSINSSL